MAESKKVPKMAQTVNSDGSVTFTFALAAGPQSITARLDEFPQNVRDFFAMLGMRTGLRNSTVPGADEKESLPEDMFRKLSAKLAQYRAGTLRAITADGEKAPASTLILEAALIYRKMKAAVKATGKVDGWQEQDTGDTLESIRPTVESMDDTVTNPADVEKAKAEASAKGEDVEAAAKGAAVTQLDQLKATTLFKLAYAEAKKVREDAKRAALAAKAAAEAADAPM